MPHKRAKRSVREASKKHEQTDLAPTPIACEPIPKGIARVLGAEQIRATYRQRRRAEENETKPNSRAEEVQLHPGESLREFNRRVEDAHRPMVRAAMKQRKGEAKSDTRAVEKEETSAVESDGVGGGKRKREEKEFERFSSSAPRRLNEVATAPPVFSKLPRGSGASGGRGGSVTMARQVMLEQERTRVIEAYRMLKRKGHVE